MATRKQSAVGKRQGINDSNKTMFLWVAGASVVVGFALVFAWFLWQQIAFKTTVINAKNDTISQLEKNNDAVEILRDDIRVLRTNEALEQSKASPDQNPVQVILDALPADANELALGASLQKRFIDPVDGITLESLRVEPISDSSTDNSIDFSINVKAGSANPLRELLERFERSIRVIDIETMVLERSGSGYTLSLNAKAYYEPALEITLDDKEITR